VRFKEDLNRTVDDISFRLNLIKDIKKETNLYLSNNFNVFKYIPRLENILSNILADLLETDGSHGQGDIFQKLFLQLIAVDEFKNEIYSVRRESLTDEKRRIDILMESPKYLIGIENKPWESSGEQENQIEDYIKYLNRQQKKSILIFLTYDGREPTSLVDKTGLGKTIFNFSYSKEIILWLESCYKESKSEKMRIFLSDLKSIINKRFIYENSY
jgi:hypothetical protein